MYVAIIDFPILDQDRARALAALSRDAKAARAMPGNLAFRVLSDAKNTEQITVLHRWEDKAACDAYVGSPLFTRIGEEIRPLMAGAPVSLRLHAHEDAPDLDR
ncbi:MAG: putative quinol monooxygenase [Pseudooceanicola sp.]